MIIGSQKPGRHKLKKSCHDSVNERFMGEETDYENILNTS